jgi:O-antigen ligase
MYATTARMKSLTSVAVFFLALGTFVSVTVQGVYQLLIIPPLLWHFHRVWGRNFRLPASSWWMLAFVISAALSTVLAWDDVARPWKSLKRLDVYLIAVFSIFPIAAWIREVSTRTLNRLVRVLALTMVASAAWLAWQKFILGATALKPFTETMRFAYGTALVMVLAIGLVLHRSVDPRIRSWLPRRWGWVLVGFGVASVVLVNSRGALAALLLALPAVCWFWRPRVGAVMLALGIAVGGALAWNYLYGTRDESSVRILANKNNLSDQIRRSQWQAARIAWSERPVWGWGYRNFHTQVTRIKATHDLPAKEYGDAHAHNVILEIAAGTGAVGLLLFLIAFGCWVYECWRGGGLVRVLMLPFFVSLMFEAQFEVILDANNATWIGFLYALSIGVGKRYQTSVD